MSRLSPRVLSSLIAVAATLLLGLSMTGSNARAQAAEQAETAPPLNIQVYTADSNSFNVNAVLITGRQDAVLLDTGFTKADALRIAAMVLDSGKRLTTIYISQPDPDYYFGAAVLQQFFPDARLVATPQTISKMKATLPVKLEVWGPRLGENGPDAIPVPDALDGHTLILEDQVLEIRGLNDSLPHRSYVWIPSIRTVAGGTNLSSGQHVWTADTQTVAERTAWIEKLNTMAALRPVQVIPGHSAPGTSYSPAHIRWTQTYLSRFEQERAKAKNSEDLIHAMKAAYPESGGMLSLEMGARVNTGEMMWQ